MNGCHPSVEGMKYWSCIKGLVPRLKPQLSAFGHLPRSVAPPSHASYPAFTTAETQPLVSVALPQKPLGTGMPPPLPQLCSQVSININHDTFPWSEVVKGDKPRDTRPVPPSVRSDAYLDQRISKLRHRKSTCPRRTDIYIPASKVYNSLRDAQEMDHGNSPLLHENLAMNFITFCGLIRKVSLAPDAAEWIAATLAEPAMTKAARPDSSLRIHSVDRTQTRKAEDPSSGRGASKLVALHVTSDTDSSRLPPPHRSSRPR